MTTVQRTLTELKKRQPNTLTQSELLMLRLGDTMSKDKVDELRRTSDQERHNTAALLARLKEEGHWTEPVIIDGQEWQFECSEAIAIQKGYNPAVLY